MSTPYKAWVLVDFFRGRGFLKTSPDDYTSHPFEAIHCCRERDTWTIERTSDCVGRWRFIDGQTILPRGNALIVWPNGEPTSADDPWFVEVGDLDLWPIEPR